MSLFYLVQKYHYLGLEEEFWMINKTNQKAQNLVDFPQYQATLAETQTGAPFIQYNLDVTPDS